MSMWEPFTEGARRAIVHAQEEAQFLGDDVIAPFHLLAGILCEPGESLAPLLRRFDLTLERLRALRSSGAHKPAQAEMSFTPQAKRAIERSFETARRKSNNFVGIEHLLWGTLNAHDRDTAAALRELDINPAALSEEALTLVPEGASSGSGMREPIVAMAQALLAQLERTKAPALDAEQRAQLTRLRTAIDNLLSR